MTKTCVNGNPAPMEHFMEAAVRGMGFTLIKDGKEWIEGRDQSDPKECPTQYVRVYQLILDNHPVALRCRFIYDIRKGISSCEFRPSVGECMNAIAHMAIGKEVDLTEEENW